MRISCIVYTIYVDYSKYKENIDIDKLRNFFDDIETNKNYFRLNIKKSKRFLNKNNDTLTIKNIISNVNKCTESNIDEILKLIIQMPILLQRPLVTKYINSRAVMSMISRPPEKIDFL